MASDVERLTQAMADRYRIQRELGRGGNAIVYQATDVKHGREVAVKVLRLELAGSIAADRFLREIQFTARLDHPHILPLLDSGTIDGFLFYVMPYAAGESLRRRLTRERQLPVADALSITREVADALDYAHSLKVVHRDIKPENILLTHGHARVADFGIARAISEAGGGLTLTSTGLAVGTPPYMSPEQITALEIDHRADVYALGCVCYEMLAGQPPFAGPTAESVLRQHMVAPPPDVSTVRSTVSLTVGAAIQRALGKAAGDRFDSAGQFADSLHASSNSPVTQTAKVRWGGGRKVAGATAVVATVLAAWLLSTRAHPNRVVVSRLDEVQGLPGPDDWTPVAISPDGNRVVYRGSRSDSGFLYVRYVDDLVARRLPGTASASVPFFSPDGEWIGFQQGSALRVLRMAGGAPITLVDRIPYMPGASWGDDGTIVFSNNYGGLVRISRDAPGIRDTLTTLDAAWPHVLPNGDAVLFQMRTRDLVFGDAALAALSLRTGEITELGINGVRPRYVSPGFIIYGVRGGEIEARPFDAKRLRVTGPPQTLVEDAASAYSFGVAANALVYQRADHSATVTIAWVTRDGRVSDVDSAWRGDFQGLALSPDGSRLATTIAADGERQIWIKQLPRGPALKLTLDGTTNHRPVWLPNGQTIAFISNRRDIASLYRQPADGRTPAEVVIDLQRPVWEGAWSPVGDWIVFRLDDGVAHEDLWATRPSIDTATIGVSTSHPDTEVMPSFSPDGRFIAYQSDESGRPEVVVRPFPRVADGKWIASVGGGTQPHWSRSGSELFYVNADRHIVAASVTTKPDFEITSRTTISNVAVASLGFANRVYDVSPDARRFIIIRSDSTRETQREIILFQHFVERLKHGSQRE